MLSLDLNDTVWQISTWKVIFVSYFTYSFVIFIFIMNQLPQSLAYLVFGYLFQNLGNFGPLKCREIYSLEKLSKQADIIEDLISIAKAGSVVTNLHAGKLDHQSNFFNTICVDAIPDFVSCDACLFVLFIN